MLFEPGFDHEDWALPAPAPLDGDGGPAVGDDWLAAAFDRPFGRLTDLYIDERPPVMPEGFDLDLLGRKAADEFVMFGDEPPVTEVDDVVVPGVRPPTVVNPGWGDDSPYPVMPGGGGGGDTPPEEEEDHCPYTEAYEDAAGTVGLLSDVLGTLRDSPFSLGSRDDRAVDSAKLALDALETSLMTGQISLTSLESTLTSIFEILMNEASDTVIVGLGSAAGAGAAWWIDGPLPVGEILGAIVGAVSAFVAGQFINHREVANALAKALLEHLNLEDIEGPCRDD